MDNLERMKNEKLIRILLNISLILLIFLLLKYSSLVTETLVLYMLTPTFFVLLNKEKSILNSNTKRDKLSKFYIYIFFIYLILLTSSLILKKDETIEVILSIIINFASFIILILIIDKSEDSFSILNKITSQIRKVDIKLILLSVSTQLVRLILIVGMTIGYKNTMNILGQETTKIFNGNVFVHLLLMIPNFIFSLIIYMGEEYCWRFYLQDHLVKKFSFIGIIILGIIWGLWHLPLDIIVSKKSPLYSALIMQLSTSIFFGFCLTYISMKTNNLLTTSFIHHINNAMPRIFLWEWLNLSPEMVNLEMYSNPIKIIIIDLIVFLPYIILVYKKLKNTQSSDSSLCSRQLK